MTTRILFKMFSLPVSKSFHGERHSLPCSLESQDVSCKLKGHLLLALFALFLSTVLPALGQNFSKADLISDIDDYGKQIQKKHANPFNYISKEHFIDSLNSLKKRATEMDMEHVYTGFVQLNALLNDPHTSIERMNKKLYPILVMWFEEGFYIVSSSIVCSEFAGDQLLEIEGRPVDSVARILGLVIPGANTSWKRYMTGIQLLYPDLLYGLNITPSPDSARFTVLHHHEKKQITLYAQNEFSAEFQPMKFAKPLLRMASSLNYSYQVDNAHKSLYINYIRCMEMKELPFNDFLGNVLHDLCTNKTERLIIDMRNNSGGSVAVFKPLIRAVARDSIRSRLKIAVLIGRKTFSAAIWNTWELKTRLKAVLIGEETGGDLNHPGSVTSFSLRKTKLKVYYSNYDYYFDATVKGGILPDIAIPYRFSDYSQGIDPVLEKALEME